MKNGTIKISVFTVLNEIAKHHRIKAYEWAKAAWGDERLHSRISELRRLQRNKDKGVDDQKVGRALSVEKVAALLAGLKKLLGGDVVKKELLDKLATVKTAKEKNLILIMAADDDDQETIRAIIETILKQKK